MPIPYTGGDVNFWEILKTKKSVVADVVWQNLLGNHPNRLASISMAGTTSFDRDGRVSETGLTTTRRLIEVDYSLFPTWSRIIRPKTPLLVNQTTFGTGEFGFFSRAGSVWKFDFTAAIRGATPASVVVGTDTTYYYSRAVDTDPWTEDSSVPSDISMQWSPVLAANALNHFGGDPVSGGKGPDNEDNSISISNLPYDVLVPYFNNLVIYRLPWDQAWANESDLLSDAFDDYLAAEIAANPSTAADYSGTCTAEVVFTF